MLEVRVRREGEAPAEPLHLRRHFGDTRLSRSFALPSFHIRLTQVKHIGLHPGYN